MCQCAYPGHVSSSELCLDHGFGHVVGAQMADTEVVGLIVRSECPAFDFTGLLEPSERERIVFACFAIAMSVPVLRIVSIDFSRQRPFSEIDVYLTQSASRSLDLWVTHLVLSDTHWIGARLHVEPAQLCLPGSSPHGFTRDSRPARRRHATDQ